MAEEFVVDAKAASSTELDSGVITFVLRVKDPHGNPVTGLTKSDFVVIQMTDSDAEVTPILEGSIDLTAYGVLDGTYRFHVQAFGGHGQLVFAIVVTSLPLKVGTPGMKKGASATGRGQGITSVFRSQRVA
jgi:hypothetical protein